MPISIFLIYQANLKYKWEAESRCILQDWRTALDRVWKFSQKNIPHLLHLLHECDCAQGLCPSPWMWWPPAPERSPTLAELTLGTGRWCQVGGWEHCHFELHGQDDLTEQTGSEQSLAVEKGELKGRRSKGTAQQMEGTARSKPEEGWSWPRSSAAWLAWLEPRGWTGIRRQQRS